MFSFDNFLFIECLKWHTCSKHWPSIFGFFFHWVFQTLHLNLVQKNVVQWIFWFKNFDKITRYKYFQNRKHKNGLYVWDSNASHKSVNAVLSPHSSWVAPNAAVSLQLIFLFLCISVKICRYSTLCLMTPYFKTKLVKIWGTEMAAKYIQLGRELCG